MLSYCFIRSFNLHHRRWMCIIDQSQASATPIFKKILQLIIISTKCRFSLFLSIKGIGLANVLNNFSFYCVPESARSGNLYIHSSPVPMLSLAINSNFVIKASNITRSQTKFEISSALSLQPDLHSFAIFIAPFKLTRQIHLLPI